MANRTDTLQNEKQGEARAKGEIKYADTKNKRSGDQKIRNEMKDALQKLYNDTEALPNSSSYRALLPEKGNIKQINDASMEDIKKWSKTIKQRRAEYEQQVKKIAPAATPSAPTAPSPATTAPAPAAQTPANPAPAAAAPTQPATATPDQVSGVMDAIRADSPVNKLMTPPSFPTAGTPQAAQPFAPTAPQVGPTAAQAPAAPAAAPSNSRAMTTPPAGAATVPSFKAQLDAKLAAMRNPTPAASTFKQLQPQDEVAAMEEQMIGGGYQIQKGGLKKDSAGYHVIDEKGRKIMVAPTAAMRFNVQERLNGMGGLSNTLKPGQTMTDRASAYMGRAPQPVANTIVRDAQARLNQMHLADQQAVMKAYPLIGNKGGAMNKLFTDAYHAAPKGTDMMKLANSMFAKGGTHFDAYSSMPKTPFEQPVPVGPTVPAEQQSPLDAIAAQSPIAQMMKPPTSTMMKAAYANRPPPPQPLGSAETGQLASNAPQWAKDSPLAGVSTEKDAPLQPSPFDALTPKTKGENAMVSHATAAPGPFAGLTAAAMTGAANATQAMRAQPAINAQEGMGDIQQQTESANLGNAAKKEQGAAQQTAEQMALEEEKKKNAASHALYRAKSGGLPYGPETGIPAQTPY